MNFYDMSDVDRYIEYIEQDKAKALEEARVARAKLKILARIKEIKVLQEVDRKMIDCAVCTWWREGDKENHTCGLSGGERLPVMRINQLDYADGWEKLSDELDELKRQLKFNEFK